MVLQFGLDSGVLAFTGSSIKESGGSVITSGNGANADFAYGTGSSINISNVTIRATRQYAHGIMASGGGTITVVNSGLTGTLNRGVMLHRASRATRRVSSEGSARPEAP